MPILLCAILSIVASGAGQLLLRHGAMATPPVSLATVASPDTWVALLLNGSIIAGVAAWITATLLWIVVLNRAPLSYVYVLGGLNYVAVPLLSRWLFAEQLSRLQVFGMIIIAAGVVLTLFGRTNALTDH